MKAKILGFILFLYSFAISQTTQNLILTTYSGDGTSAETPFTPTIASTFSINFDDITSVERPDSVGLVVINATYAQILDPLIRTDTTAFILSRDPSQNNRVQFVAFLANKRNGRALADSIARRPNVNVNDIITELKRIDREKRPRGKR